MKANHMKKTIEMTKTEANKAGKIGTDEYENLKTYKTDFPNYKIEIVKSSKRKTTIKGLTFEYMEVYIKTHGAEADALLVKFNELRGIVSKNDKEKFGEDVSNVKAVSYGKIKKWFLEQFPEIKDFHEDHTKKVEAILNAA